MIDVHFKLTDPEYRPLADVPVRVVLGSGWQDPDAGERFVTDAAGEHRFVDPAAVGTRWRKLPTNFVDSLFSLPKPTDHLTVAAELEYLGLPRRYVIDICRFRRGGDTMLDGFSVYSADERGRFTRKARQDGAGGWRLPELDGLALTMPGHKPWDFLLEPAPPGWSLRIAFQRFPAPILR